MDWKILYEDNHIIAINKPNGYLVHSDRTGDESLEDLLKEYIKIKYNKPGNVYLKSIHRLDRPVTGALMFAKTDKARSRMAKLFHDRKVKKVYWALSHKMPYDTSGKLVHQLKKNKQKNISFVPKTPDKYTREAITHYELLGHFGEYFLIEAKPVTGRSHQIRVQLSLAGSPILGDVKYEGKKIGDKSRILLHCRSMEFIHPVKREPLKIEAPLPEYPDWKLISKAYL